MSKAPNEDVSYYTKQVVQNAHLTLGSSSVGFIRDSALLLELLKLSVQAVDLALDAMFPLIAR
jgi:hypothetical protein